MHDLLASARLLVGNDLMEPEASKVLPPHEFMSSRVSLQLASSASAFKTWKSRLRRALEEQELSANWIDLAVLLSTPKLKIVEALRYPLIDLDALDLQLDLVTSDHRPVPLRTPVSGCNVEVCIVLSKSLEPVSLKPWRQGTWLARIKFALRTDLAEPGFVPIPLTAQDRVRLGLSDDTVRFVKVEESPLERGVGDDAVSVYVDQELLAQLTALPLSPASKSFQRQLFLDAVAAIVTSALRQSDFTTMVIGDLEGSIVGKLIAKMAGQRSGERDVDLQNRQDLYLTMLKEEPERFLAGVEARISPKSDLTRMLAGGDS
jgi:hypothetical protein